MKWPAYCRWLCKCKFWMKIVLFLFIFYRNLFLEVQLLPVSIIPGIDCVSSRRQTSTRRIQASRFHGVSMSSRVVSEDEIIGKRTSLDIMCYVHKYYFLTAKDRRVVLDQYNFIYNITIIKPHSAKLLYKRNLLLVWQPMGCRCIACWHINNRPSLV